MSFVANLPLLPNFVTLLLLSVFLSATICTGLDLTVIHTNDLHSRFDEITVRGSTCRDKDRAAGKCYGGVARIKGISDEIRDREDNVIMLNAGDFFQVSCSYSQSINFLTQRM